MRPDRFKQVADQREEAFSLPVADMTSCEGSPTALRAALRRAR
jgi:hypothetical protein